MHAKWKKLELRFPITVYRNELLKFCAHHLDWPEPPAGTFASVLAVDLAQPLITTRGEKVVRIFDVGIANASTL